MKKSFGEFDAALHATGKSLDPLFGAIGKANASEDFVDPHSQRGSAQAVKMSLMPEVLIGGEFRIDTLCLEHHADLAAQGGRILRGIVPHHKGASGGGDHQG